MNRRLWTCATLVACAVALLAPAARGEVYADLSASGSFAGVHIAVPQGAEGRIWKNVGAAERSAQVLNPDGDARGDGRPDFAIDPLSGLPRAVWAARTGPDYEVMTSDFDGESWSTPVVVRAHAGIDDLDPRIVFRRDGYAIVTWWQKSTAPVVRMAFLPPGAEWSDGGIVSAAGVKARKPAIRQEGMLTIVAYRMPKDIGIVTFTAGMFSPRFGDGPTPFPRDLGGGPDSSNPPVVNP